MLSWFFKFDQYLNDVVVDFYLLYQFDQLPQETQRRIHIYPSTFYKRLRSHKRTVKQGFDISGLTKSELQHLGVREAFIKQAQLISSECRKSGNNNLIFNLVFCNWKKQTNWS